MYTVGVGTAGGPVEIPVPVRDPETGQVVERRVMAQVDVDEKLLGRIAETTGGRFFRATDPSGLAQTYAEIDRLEKTEVKTTTYTRWRETFPRVAVPAAGVLAAAALVALDEERGRLAEDHARLSRLARGLAGLRGVSLDPAAFPTNILIADLDPRVFGAASDALARLRERGVLGGAAGERSIRLVTHADVGDADVDRALGAFGELSSER